MSLKNLVGLIPPHEGARTVVDWQLAERAYGVRFPADYQSFMARYGSGTIENYLTVLEPGVSADGEAEGPMTFISERLVRPGTARPDRTGWTSRVRRSTRRPASAPSARRGLVVQRFQR